MKTPLRILTGLLAGISLGLLFAPKKGKDLRRELAGSDDKMGDFGKQWLLAARDASGEVKKFLGSKEVQDLIKSGKAEFQDFVNLARKKGEELSEDAKAELQEMTSELNRKVHSARKSLKRKGNKARRKVREEE